MTRVKEIKQAIEKLPQDDFIQLRKWLMELDWQNWDRQIEKDSKMGKMDFLRDESQSHKTTGKLKPL